MTTPHAVLYFDTSGTAAGVLLEQDHPEPRIIALRRLIYETQEGDRDIEILFGAAEDWRKAHPGGTIGVGCECVFTGGGWSPQERLIRDAMNRRKGQLQLHARTHNMTWGGEISPSTGKLALTGKGNAGKQRMVMLANQRFGAQLLAVHGKLLEYTGNAKTCSEHAADAIGGAIAALAGRWIVKKARGKRAPAPAGKVRIEGGRRVSRDHAAHLRDAAARGSNSPTLAAERAGHQAELLRRRERELARRSLQGGLDL